MEERSRSSRKISVDNVTHELRVLTTVDLQITVLLDFSQRMKSSQITLRIVALWT